MNLRPLIIKSEKLLVQKFLKSLNGFIREFSLPPVDSVFVEPCFKYDYENRSNRKIWVRPDLVLAHSDSSLSVFEFKNNATPTDNIKGISQLLMYREILEKHSPVNARWFFGTTHVDEYSLRFLAKYKFNIIYLELNDTGICHHWMEVA